MSKKMLIDAAHSEEVRVCVMENGKVEDFDFESANRKPLRGNIYLARVTRVEPSLQAAFVEFGGNRHGFLAFSEIHPDYYQIPVSDRQALQNAEAEEARLADLLDVMQRGDEEDEDGGDLDDENASFQPPLIDDEDDENEDGDNADAEANEPDPESGQQDGPPPSDRTETSLDDKADHEDDRNGAAAPLSAKTEPSLTEPSLTEPVSEAGGSADAGQDVAEEQDQDEDRVEEAAGISEPAAAAHASSMDDDAPASTTDKTQISQADEQSSDHKEPRARSIDDGEDADIVDDQDRDDAVDEETQKRADERAALLEQYKDARRTRARLIRNYKIQEVVKRRQILLVQVVKEERGNKGAALTTYMSLAGRYCVLMPNTARGGGISRKIPSASDRKRLRRVVDSLDVPQGQGLIIRTAGAKRTKIEIKRDYDYLSRLWENIRTLTLESIAPCLIYEEASLIKRAIRDLYDKDIGQVLVEGEEGYREAKDFMKMLMPSHAKNVQPHKDRLPIFSRYTAENQLDAIYQPTVKLKSGGYLVIHQTEALVAIDVNSGKATRERNIEQTALRTNLEAAVETARQCRLRDLAGLVVIDFIDMEENRNNRTVEKKLKEALKNDRARIQVGRISGFGLLEMSRQRRRSGIIDGTTHACPTCNGAGVVRSHETAALRILRALEGEAIAGRAAVIAVRASLDVTLFILNHKRDWLARIEREHELGVELIADQSKAGDQYEIEKRGAPRPQSESKAVVRADTIEDVADSDPSDDGEDVEAGSEHPGDDDGQEERSTRKRRRRRRRRKDNSEAEAETTDPAEAVSENNDNRDVEAREDGESDDDQKRRRRRGRRGGRRQRKREDETSVEDTETSAAHKGGDDDAAEAVSPAPTADRVAAGAPDDNSHAPAPPLDEAPVRNANIDAPSDRGASRRAEPAAQAVEAVAVEAATPDEVAERLKKRKPSREGWWSRTFGG